MKILSPRPLDEPSVFHREVTTTVCVASFSDVCAPFICIQRRTRTPYISIAPLQWQRSILNRSASQRELCFITTQITVYCNFWIFYANIQQIFQFAKYIYNNQYRRRDSNSYRHYCPGDFRTTIAFATKTILSVPLSIQVLSISVHLAHRKNLLNCVVCGLDSLITILKVIASIRKLVDYVLPQILLYWLCLPRQQLFQFFIILLRVSSLVIKYSFQLRFLLYSLYTLSHSLYKVSMCSQASLMGIPPRKSLPLLQINIGTVLTYIMLCEVSPQP